MTTSNATRHGSAAVTDADAGVAPALFDDEAAMSWQETVAAVRSHEGRKVKVMIADEETVALDDACPIFSLDPVILKEVVLENDCGIEGMRLVLGSDDGEGGVVTIVRHDFVAGWRVFPMPFWAANAMWRWCRDNRLRRIHAKETIEEAPLAILSSNEIAVVLDDSYAGSMQITTS